MRVMTSQLIRGISAVIREVTELRALGTVPVSALELCVGVAGLDPGGAQRHVVLIRAVAAVIHAVTYLVPGGEVLL